MQQTLEKLRAFPARLESAVTGLTETQLTRPEREGKWSVQDVVSHLGDLEMVYAVRIRTILAGAGGDAPLPSLAQNEWVEHVHRREPLGELLEQFRFHRRMNLTLLERLGEEELARTGVHPEYGPISVRDAFGRIERHDEKHLGQIERVKNALQSL
jgi:uncharacterized damage-inducible protein DinB